ncbi:MAG: nickel-responsive transcriptional regulator NikR [Labilithrix sp.]|nr:nickel-responsive transcriptional regulator NikR [Labilithrix sp.]
MKDSLVRFGVAMEGSLLEEFDALVAERGGTRSELLRDLVRAEVTRARVTTGANAVASLTLVYDHHVRDLTERLTDFQHALGDKVNSALHVHLDHDHRLEVIVMKGPSDELKRAGGKLLATRGVKHGGMELIAIEPPNGAAPAKAGPRPEWSALRGGAARGAARRARAWSGVTRTRTCTRRARRGGRQ